MVSKPKNCLYKLVRSLGSKLIQNISETQSDLSIAFSTFQLISAFATPLPSICIQHFYSPIFCDFRIFFLMSTKKQKEKSQEKPDSILVLYGTRVRTISARFKLTATLVYKIFVKEEELLVVSMTFLSQKKPLLFYSLP